MRFIQQSQNKNCPMSNLEPSRKIYMSKAFKKDNNYFRKV